MTAGTTTPIDQPRESERQNVRFQNDDLQSVIDIVLRQEELRKDDERRRIENEARKAEHEQQLSDERLRDAIHVIKWCVVGISATIIMAVVLGIWALVQVEKSVAEVERDIEQVADRVDNILHEVEHPFEGAGRLLGRDIDKSVAEFLGLSATTRENH